MEAIKTGILTPDVVRPAVHRGHQTSSDRMKVARSASEMGSRADRLRACDEHQG